MFEAITDWKTWLSIGAYALGIWYITRITDKIETIPEKLNEIIELLKQIKDQRR